MSDAIALDQLIAAVDQADSPARLVGAVRALAAVGQEAAIPALIQVLGYNNPGAAIAAVEGLVRLGSAAVQPLLEQMDAYNYGARAYNIRALAAIGDPRALAVLLEAAQHDFAPSVRRAASRGLGCLHWQQLPPTDIAAAQSSVADALLRVAADADWSLRYGAIVGLQALLQAGPDDRVCHRVKERFEKLAATDDESSVRARALLALQQLQLASPSTCRDPFPVG